HHDGRLSSIKPFVISRSRKRPVQKRRTLNLQHSTLNWRVPTNYQLSTINHSKWVSARARNTGQQNDGCRNGSPKRQRPFPRNYPCNGFFLERRKTLLLAKQSSEYWEIPALIASARRRSSN